jgi:hypothetical protein
MGTVNQKDRVMNRIVRHGMLCAGLAAMSGVAQGGAPACAAASGPAVLPLIELFTSEGCDSCPPADRWLAAQYRATANAPPFVALAYHVDYWDRLGWKDRFASARFTQRQYDVMRANAATFVFTPQVVFQGHDLATWRDGRVGAALAAARAQSPGAKLQLAATWDSGKLVVTGKAEVEDIARRRQAVLWLAFADSGHVSDVKAGENRGARLAHDHVVRSLHGPYRFDAQGKANVSVDVPVPEEAGQAPMLVAFIQDARGGDVLQAMTMAVCPAPSQ